MEDIQRERKILAYNFTQANLEHLGESVGLLLPLENKQDFPMWQAKSAKSFCRIIIFTAGVL